MRIQLIVKLISQEIKSDYLKFFNQLIKMIMKTFKISLLFSVVFLMCSSCISLRNNSRKTPNNLITKERADALHSAYLSNQYVYINNDLPGNAVDNVGALVTDVNDLQLFLESVIALKKRDSISNVGVYVYFGADTLSPGVTKSTVFFEAAYALQSNTKRPSGGSSFAPGMLVTPTLPDSFLPVGEDDSYYDKLHPVGTRKTGSGN